MIWWTVLLFTLGIVLILSEFVLPGAILGILGGASILGSAAIAMYAFPGEIPLVIGAELVGVSVSLLLGILIMTKTGIIGGLTLRASQHVEEGYVNVRSDEALIGRTGLVFTALRPAGSILVGDERYDAVSSGVFIDKDATVRIIEVQGNRIVVEPAGREAPIL